MGCLIGGVTVLDMSHRMCTKNVNGPNHFLTYSIRTSCMNAYHPLPDNPEFSVLEHPGYREYRVENPRHSSRGNSLLPEWIIAFAIPSICAVLWQSVRCSNSMGRMNDLTDAFLGF